MNMFKNKKGDLSLSVNAIVILVIAIIFLGLAIGFTTKLLGKSSAKLEAGLDIDISQPASSEKQLVIDGQLRVKPGTITPIKISFYNKNANSIIGAKPVLVSCTDGTPSKIDMTAISTDVAGYSETRFVTQLSAVGGTVGDYLCKLNIIDSAATPVVQYTTQVSVSIIS